MTNSQPSNPSYLLDSHRMEEIHRLAAQSVFLTRALGGLLPERDNDFSSFLTVLDLACGPGGWIFEVAQQNPHLQIIGVDISPVMIDFNVTQAAVSGLTNVVFKVMDVTHPLQFPEQSFDFVNARLLFAFMTPPLWKALIAECWRLLKPGGFLRFIEPEKAITTSPTSQRLARIIMEGMYKQGRTFTEDGSVTAAIGQLLRSAGFQQVSLKSYLVEYSSGTPYHKAVAEDFETAGLLIKPYLKTLHLSEEEIERIFQNLHEETVDPSFGAYWPYVSWTASK